MRISAISAFLTKSPLLLLLLGGLHHAHLSAMEPARCHQLSATGNSEYPPFLWRKSDESNQLMGTNSLIMDEISDRLGLKIQLKHTGPWSRAQREVESGRIDLMAGAFYTKQRSHYMDYIEPAFLQTQSVVWTNNQPAFKYQNRESLIGKQGATVINNSFGQEFDHFAEQYLDITSVASIEQAFKMLLGKRVDYVLYEEAPGEAYIQEIWQFFPFQAQHPAISQEGLYLTFSRNSPCNTPELRGHLVNIIKDMSEEGFFQRMKQQGSVQWLMK